MTHDQYEEWVTAGRIPSKADGRPDLYKIDRALKTELDSTRRIGLLKRLMEYRDRSAH
jgi:uncharacterized tellurite resistance protein B-like protein